MTQHAQTEREQTDSANAILIHCLKHNDIFGQASALALAKIFPYIIIKDLKEGDTLFETGQAADTLYLLKSGSVSLENSSQKYDITAGCFGEETAISAEHYLSKATATEDSQVICIPENAVEKLIETHPELKDDFHYSLINHFACNISRRRSHVSARYNTSSKTQILGWLLELILPVAAYFFVRQNGLDENASLFVAILTGTTIMWMFSLLQIFLPPLFALMAIIILDIVPPSVALSGFGSSSFFLAMSVFALAGVLISTGLTYRVTLWILSKLRSSKTGLNYVMSLVGLGVVLTPILPSMSGRLHLMMPFITDMKEILGYKDKSQASTLLAIAVFTGAGMFSAIFLTGSSINLILFSLLPSQVQMEFEWTGWFVASFVAFATILIAFFLLAKFLFRNHEVPRPPQKHVQAQLQFLGPMSKQEWLTAAGITLFMIGVMTSSIHKINLAWLALFMMLAFMTIELINPSKFRSQIDWPFLVLIGAMIGIMKTLLYLGIDTKISTQLSWLGVFMKQNFGLFILLLAGLTYGLRFALPDQTVAMILATIFIPVAHSNGIHPWVIAFSILMFHEGWISPYQNPRYMFQFLTLNDKTEVFDEKDFLKFNLWVNLLRVAVIYISIPYWQYLGLL